MKILPLSVGIIILSISLFFMIIYLNLLTMGYSFFDYVKFINMRFETLLIIPGIGFVIYALRKGKNK